jgi:ABC-type transport system involved in cytochrome c biogenesis permease component
MKAWWAQTRAEVHMTIRRGETLLLTVGIPVLLLIFFSLTHVIATPTTRRIDFVAPGILALCILSTSLVALSIATGFERSYGVLRRLHVTPLGTRRLVAAKIAGVIVTEAFLGRWRSRCAGIHVADSSVAWRWRDSCSSAQPVARVLDSRSPDDCAPR